MTRKILRKRRHFLKPNLGKRRYKSKLGIFSGGDAWIRSLCHTDLESFEMRFIALGVCAIVLSACSTTAPVYMRHPQTGQTAVCGPFNSDPVTASVSASREARCITDYQRQGYERVPLGG